MFPSSAASSKGQHEITIPAGLPQYCFDGLSPDALYTATVFVQTPNLEGPGVSTKERTCECCNWKQKLLSFESSQTQYNCSDWRVYSLYMQREGAFKNS